MLDVVNTYLGLWSKLSYVDQWYTIPTQADAGRVASQRWHRDYNGRYLVKVFVYMTDVDEGSGPFEYVPQSHARGGRYAQVFPWEVFGEDLYPRAEELRRRVPPEAARTLTAPAGTVIFCDTTGFHRGGFATRSPRVMGVLNYVSQASLASLSERNFRVDPSEVPVGTPEAVRFALT
jgi:ectoine hydroxylase-related dioxygenase (phytanoyl-CoA dioxygenase family)